MTMTISTSAIASELDSVQQMSTERLMTGWFASMEERIQNLLEAYPQLWPACSRFMQARLVIWPSCLTDATWQEMKTAASELASAIRALGDIDINLCERLTADLSECGHALMPDGSCPLNWHIDN